MPGPPRTAVANVGTPEVGKHLAIILQVLVGEDVNLLFWRTQFGINRNCSGGILKQEAP
jgi:hypothetical protein